VCSAERFILVEDMAMKYPKRKPIRLARDLYQGPVVVSVTICLFDGVDVVEQGLAPDMVAILLNVVEKYGILNYAYCLMPDHVHWLLGLQDGRHNVLDIVTHFKSRVSFELRGRYETKTLWQDRFFDHIMRKDEDILKQARYILDNPCRRGLAGSFDKYAFSGGMHFEDLQRG
jgi:putative transposase